MPTSRKSFLKQTGLALAGSLLPYSKLMANVFTPRQKFAVDTFHPSDCTVNLINPVFPAAYINQADFTYHKGTYPGIIKDQLYINEEDLNCLSTTNPPTTDQCSATNNHDPDESVLRYRVYYPRSTYENATSGHDYDEVPLPCIAFFHSGGFSECVDHIKIGTETVCKEFARRGFIAFTIDYRAGRLRDEDDSRTSVQQGLAAYRGMQDARGAIRSIIKHNDDSDKHGNRFRINEDEFFVGGFSAGGIVSMGAAYYRNQGMLNNISVTANNSLTIEQALGHINADYYYGETGTDLANPLYTPIIKGVLSGWGGIVIPYSFDGANDFGTVEKGFFQGGGSGNRINPPMIGFVGGMDDVVPFADTDNFGNAPQNFLHSVATTPINYKKQNFCLETTGNYIIKNPTSANNIYVKICSAQNMYYILKELNRFTELYVDCDMGHGVDDVSFENFGLTTATSYLDVYVYIVQRAAIFFQTILQQDPSDPFLPFNHRGRSIFRGVVPALNNRICTQCDGVPATDVCNVTDDPICE